MSTPDRTRWAGAPGFDRAYRVMETYRGAYDELVAAIATVDRYQQRTPDHRDRGFVEAKIRNSNAALTVLELERDMIGRQSATLHTLADEQDRREGREPPPRARSKPDGRIVIPGASEEEVETFSMDTPEERAQLLAYARPIAAVADGHLAALADGVPVVFDPLSVPELTPDAVEGFRAPFRVTVADFLQPSGMSLPVAVQGIEGAAGYWVGLIAATVIQHEDGGPVDVWPVVTTLRDDLSDEDQRRTPKDAAFGMVRFGGELPEDPVLARYRFRDADVHMVPLTHGDPFADLWVRQPALAAISALRILDAVNVDLEPVILSRPDRRRMVREGAQPALTVNVTTRHGARPDPTPQHGTVEWSHRWTVRGHWKHYGEHTRLARAHPSRVVEVPGHGRCVRVWCPSFVKGPAGKPLVLKTRVVLHSGEGMGGDR